MAPPPLPTLGLATVLAVLLSSCLLFTDTDVADPLPEDTGANDQARDELAGDTNVSDLYDASEDSTEPTDIEPADRRDADSDTGGESCGLVGVGESCLGDECCLSGNCSNERCAPEGFVYVPPGTFCMGSPDGLTECLGVTPVSEAGNETLETLHEVTLTRGFFLQETEVTQRQWTAMEFINPSEMDECGLDCPVEMINWWEAVAYANALSESEGLKPCYTLDGCEQSSAGTGIECPETTVSDPEASGNPYLCEGYRLPTESEWEYAYRAGTRTAFYSGGITNTGRSPLDENLDLIGWYGGNSGVSYRPGYDCAGWHDGATTCGAHEVGGKAANDLSVYDMSGNVWEWVWDWYQSDYYASSPPLDPPGGEGSYRVFRGGSWGDNAKLCRAASRSQVGPGSRSISLGFRPARSALP